MAEVKWDDANVVNALQRLQHAVSNTSPVLKEIGEVLQESTKHRFEASTGPDGEKWEPNSHVTTAQHVHRVGGTKTKDGKFLTKKGEQRWDGKKTLIDHGTLMESINAQLIDNNTLGVGSALEYAAMQQFGGSKDDFPFLWGDIPARPFLGISDEDEDKILSTVHEYLTSSI